MIISLGALLETASMSTIEKLCKIEAATELWETDLAVIKKQEDEHNKKAEDLRQSAVSSGMFNYSLKNRKG